MTFKPDEQASIFNRLHGCYFVEYPEGGRSRLMRKREAKGYARIFGGTVHRDPDAPTLLTRLRRWLGI